MNNLSDYCAPNCLINDEMIDISSKVSLRLITFKPPNKTNNPPVLFVAGWVSQISGWQEVLREMTKDFIVYYIETREKSSSIVRGKVEYTIEAKAIEENISSFSGLGVAGGEHIVEARLGLKHFNLADKNSAMAAVDAEIIENMKQRRKLLK